MKLHLTTNLKSLEKALFFLTILFLPTQLGKHFWPDFSFVYSLRVDYLSPTIYFWDLLIISLIGINILNKYITKRKLSLNYLYLSLLLFFIFSQLASLFNAVNPFAALYRLKEYLITGLFGLYVSSVSFPKIKKALFLGLALSVVFTCFLAIIQFLLGHSVGLWIIGERSFSVTTPLIARFNFYEKVFLRPYATFPHPNMLAAFLVIVLPLLNYGIPGKLKNFKLVNTFLSTSAVFITFSRPSLILIGLQIILMFKKFWKILLILGVLTTPLIFVRLSSIFTFDNLAVLRRRELSEYALFLFQQYPVFGVGLNNFINVLASDHILVGTSRFLQPVHNIFLYTLAETGLIGLTGLSLFIGTSLIINLKSNSPFARVLVGSLFMIIFLGLFDHYFLTLPQGQRLFFLILGLSLSRTINNSSNTHGSVK